MKRSRLSMVFTALILLFAVIVLAPQASAIEDSDLCYEYTPQMAENTFRYLDEFYIEKYPEAALRVDVGKEEDRQNLKKLSNIITDGCSTDAEKATAILRWIQRNIEYSGGGFYSYDAFYTREGSCAAQANLMRDLLRFQGIPAVYGDGFREDMQTLTVESMHNLLEGHAWCFAYIDGEWLLYDPLWLPNGITDREYIAKNYFLDAVECIVPAYDINNLPPTRGTGSFSAYIDGRILSISGNSLNTTFGNVGVNINMVYQTTFTVYISDSDGMNYADNPARRNSMILGEVYTDGWLTYSDKLYGFYWENGCSFTDTVLSYNGERYYSNGGSCLRFFLEESEYYIKNGALHVLPGFSGKVFEPPDLESRLNHENRAIVWESDDPSVATIDQNGVITFHDTGYCHFWVKIINSETGGLYSSRNFEIICREDTRTADFSDRPVAHDCSFCLVEEKEPSCTEPGYYYGVCSCGEELRTAYAPLGHSGPWTIVTEPTETTEGLQKRTCTVCGAYEQQAIPITHVCTYDTRVVEREHCTDMGIVKLYCKCGNYIDGGEDWGTWHTMGDEIILKAPTQYEPGLMRVPCIYCSYEEFVEIPSLFEQTGVCTNHVFSPWETVFEPGPNSEGLKYRYCEYCGYYEEKILPPTGGTGQDPNPNDPVCSQHKYTDWATTQEPTFSRPGIQIRECKVCGHTEYLFTEVLKPNTPSTPFDGPTLDILTDPTLLSIVEQTPVGGTLVLPMEPGTGLHMEKIFVEAMVNANITLVLDYSGIKITFDNAAIQAMAAGMAGDEAVIVLETIDETALNPLQQAALQGQAVPLLFNIRVLSGGQEVSDFGSGTVTFSIPAATVDPAEEYRVVCVREDGSLEPLPAALDGDAIVCTTDHFSVYAVIQPKSEPEPEPTVPSEPAPTEPEPTEPQPSAPVQTEPVTSPTGSKPAPTEPVKEPEESKSPASWLLPAAIGGVVAGIAIAILVVYLIKRKKA